MLSLDHASRGSRPLAWAFARSLEDLDEEVDTPLACDLGEAPSALNGLLFRNGTGRLSRGGVTYGHLFDGDGMLSRFTFERGRVRYRNRFLRTREWVEEQRAGKIVYRGFGTNIPGGFAQNALRLRFKNAANTSVIQHAGKLLALWEGGLPHWVDPASLDTLGRYDFDEALIERHPVLRHLAPELPFSAHPKFADGALYNFGTLLGAEPQLLLYRVDAAGVMGPVERVALPALSFVHDFVLTERHRVFVLPPVAFDVPRALLGLVTPVRSLSSAAGKPTRVLVLPRDAPGPARWFEAPSGFVFHWVNGYDDGDAVVVEGFCAREMPLAASVSTLKEAPPLGLSASRLTRMILTPGQTKASLSALEGWHGELPQVHPLYRGKPYRYAWSIGTHDGAGEGLFDHLLKFDRQSNMVLSHRFEGAQLPGEPVMVPRPGAKAEDDGWLLSLVYDGEAHRSRLYCLDAATLAVCARWSLPHHQPPGFHGFWQPLDTGG